MSMLPLQQPPLMDVAPDTVPELEPILSFLNSQSNKLYHEGFFLKLNDLDTRRLKLSCVLPSEPFDRDDDFF
jgi:CCR4-NOT transcriptional complex subunit CAF120